MVTACGGTVKDSNSRPSSQTNKRRRLWESTEISIESDMLYIESIDQTR